MRVQAPPNLSPDTEIELIAAGINDFGGVSPVTCDHVNPEAPWPQLAVLKNNTARANILLVAVKSGEPSDFERAVVSV